MSLETIQAHSNFSELSPSGMSYPNTPLTSIFIQTGRAFCNGGREYSGPTQEIQRFLD